jgi:protein subunit release factor A
MRDEDLEIYAWPNQRNHGGQHVGTFGHGVLLIHVPTQVAVVETSDRSQMKNRMRAMARLRSLLDAIGEDEDDRTT